jgi:hypothetical protein
MKRLSFLFVFPFLSACFCHAQSPERLNYQAVVRNASGSLVSNQATGMRISILKGTATGASVYTETHTKTSNANGLITLEIGGGTAASGNFNLINWGEGPYFIKTETDPTGGTNYLLVATSQLLSVPYSLFAQSASLKASSIGDTLFSGKQFVVVPGLSNANSQDNPANGTALVLTRPVSNLTSASVSLSGEVSNGGGSPVTSRGFCYSTTASPTTANNIVAAGSGTGSFTANLSGINPATTYYLRTYAVNASGTSYGNQVLFTTPGAVGQACAQGSTLTVTHTAGDVAPVSKTVTYKIIQTDITRESKCWLAQNLGADRQATSLDDYSEASAGWYWQFGQKRGYKNDGISRVPNTWGNPAPDTSSWLPSNDPCRLLMGQGWRIPTMMEYSFLLQNWNTNPVMFNSPLRFHYAGLLRDGGLKDIGIYGYYATNYYYSKGVLILGSNNQSVIWAPHHTDAISMRCIKD